MKIVENLSSFAKSAKNGVVNHSPEILLVVGISSAVASTILACKATLKVNDILDENKKTLDKIHSVSEDESMKETYTEKDAKMDLAKAYAKTGVELAKLYSLPATLSVVSVVSILASYNIMRERNVALVAAYATLSEGFVKYRERVIEKYGSEVDNELRFGIKAEEIEETVVDEKTGEEKSVKKTVKISDIDGYSDYAVYFDSSSPYYESNDDYNKMFLMSQQRYASDLLRINGIITLNQVLDNLGIKANDRLRKAGLVVGWKYEKDNKIGDNKVLFDIIETYREREDGKIEPVIILDFNVDGNIFDRM